MLSKSHVACNIYISVGLPVYRGVLERLLAEAQHEQSKYLTKSSSSATIVHAFADTHYDRTSFHLAGSPWAIADLATTITSNAMQVLAPLKLEREKEMSSEKADSAKQLEHPTVGIVDHISILPLGSLNDAPAVTWNEWQAYYKDHSDNNHDNTTRTAIASSDGILKPSTTFPSGWVAWTIGWNLLQKENLPVDVLFYGHAHPENKPLAKVRRENTKFFRPPTESSKSGDDGNNSNDSVPPATTTSFTTSLPSMGQCTIGAPPHFVENYNLRLTSKASKKLARSLTKAVREKDGGLPGVEALTLPYGSQDRFEVACNLLNPQVTSSADIDERVAQFWKEHNLNQTEHLDIAYRVGATEEQCVQVLKQSQSKDQAEQHKEMVHQRFQACFESNLRQE